MGGQISTPQLRMKKSKNNQSSSSFLDNDQTDLLSNDFLNEAVKECVDHALFEETSIQGIMKQRFEFYISCQRLPNMDSFSKTDACVYCYFMKENEPDFVHCTEVIADEQDPSFARPLPMILDSSTTNKEVIFSVFDIDKFNYPGEHERQYIGSAQSTVSTMISQQPFYIPLRYDEKMSGESKKEIQQARRSMVKGTSNMQRGFLKVRAYNCDQYSDKFLFQIDGINIKSKDAIYLRISTTKLKRRDATIQSRMSSGNNDSNNNQNQFQSSNAAAAAAAAAAGTTTNQPPNLNNNLSNMQGTGLNGSKTELNGVGGMLSSFSSQTDNEEWKDIPIYQTDLQKVSKTIEWPAFEIDEKKILGNLKFEVYTFSESSVRKELLGELKVSKNSIANLHRTEQQIRAPGKKSIVGQMKFNRVQFIMHPYTMVQYIYGGLNLQFLMAFDFSTDQSSSAHFAGLVANTTNYAVAGTTTGESYSKNMQLYEKAIGNCIDLVRFYSTNHMVPMYGIGARLPPSFTHHSNCFALSGDWYEPEVDISAKENAFEVYRSEVKRVKPSASLVFSDMLRFANSYCNEEEFTKNKQTVCVLLIFSHNELLESDIDQTIAQLSVRTAVPLCVVNICLGSMQYVSKIQESAAGKSSFHSIPFDAFRNDASGFCMKIMKAVPKACLDKARSSLVPPILPFSNLQEARRHYLSSLRIGERKSFASIDERPFYEQLTQELGYKVELIREIFASGLEEEDVGLVLDRIGSFTQAASLYKRNNQGRAVDDLDSQTIEQKILQKAKDYHRTKHKFNAHTKSKKPNNSNTFAIKKENVAQTSSPFSFFTATVPGVATTPAVTIVTNQQQQQHSQTAQLLQSPRNSQDSAENQAIIQQIRSHTPMKQNSEVKETATKRNEVQPKSFLGKIKAIAEKKQDDQSKQTTIQMQQQWKNTTSDKCEYCDGSKREIILMPCGHDFCCRDTVEGVAFCPLCASPIQQKIRFSDENQFSQNDVILSNNFYSHNHVEDEIRSSHEKSISSSGSASKQNPHQDLILQKTQEPNFQLFVDVSEFQQQVNQTGIRKKDRRSNQNTIIQKN